MTERLFCFFRNIFQEPSPKVFWKEPAALEALKPGEGPEKTPEEKTKPIDYLQYLVKDPKYNFTYLVKLVREEGTKPPYPDYATTWLNNPTMAADYIEQNFPPGPGQKKLIGGLRKTPKLEKVEEGVLLDPDFDSAYDALRSIIAKMQARDQFYAQVTQQRMELLKKGPAIPEITKTGVSNFINHVREADTYGKVYALAIAAGGVWVLKQVWDWIKKNDKRKMALGIGVAALIFNESFRIFSKDKRSGLEHLDVGAPVENLKNSIWGLFALDRETGKSIENPNEVKAMLHLGQLDFKRILAVYERYPVRTRGRFTEEELNAVGLDPAAAKAVLDDRKHGTSEIAFLVIDKLVRKAGANHARKIQKEQGIKLDASKVQDLGIAAIKEKYTEGPMAAYTWTVEEILTYEYAEWAGEMEGGVEGVTARYFEQLDGRQIPARLMALGAAAGNTFKEGTQKALDGLGKGWDTASGWVREKYKEYFPKAKRALGIERLELARDLGDIRGAIDSGVPLEIPEPGKILVFGVPLSFKKEGSKYTIDEDLIFEPGLGIHNKQNQENVKKLRARAKEKVKSLAKTSGIKNIGKLKLDKIEWDGKKWVLKDVAVKEFPDLAIPATKKNLEVNITEDGKVELFVGAVKIDDVDKLNENSNHAFVVEEILKAYPFLDGMLITIKTLKTAGVEVIIEATIGGLDTGAIKFHAGARPNFAKKLDTLKLNDAFIKGRIALKVEDENFRKLFENLYFQMANAPEWNWEKVKSMWARRKLWIIPASPQALFTNSIAEKRWQYVLDSKMAETLWKLEKGLQGKQLGGVESVEIDIFGGPGLKGIRSELIQMRNDINADTDIPKNFSDHLKRLEELGYGNKEYKDKFRKYIETISSDEFDYAGFDNGEFTENSHISYAKLLRIWYYYTYPFSGPTLKGKTTLSDARIGNLLDDFTIKVKSMLQKAQQSGKIPNTIFEDEIPENPSDWKEIEQMLKAKYPEYKMS